MKTLCVSLETAKALKAAGWKKPTAYSWIKTFEGTWYVYPTKDLVMPPGGTPLYAPTAEEVLRGLPDFINGDKHIMFQKHDRNWFVGYFHDPINAYKVICAKSFSEAAALMWMWCVEQGYIKPEAHS